MIRKRIRRLEINGGNVIGESPICLKLPATKDIYADAQIDDYGLDINEKKNRGRRRHLIWRPGVHLFLRAQFSHGKNELVGTAGFGFWNAPYGDSTVRSIVLPQAAWFFYASPPNDLPFAQEGPGRGWFAATIDASTKTAVAMVPFAPLILILNQFHLLRKRVWPVVRRRSGISFAPIGYQMDAWHEYELAWMPEGCSFKIDGEPVLQTEYSPRGPLGFVCWIDNQYLVLTNRGRLGWGVLPTNKEQWLEIEDLQISSSD